MGGLFDILSPDLAYETSNQQTFHAAYETYAPTITSKKSLQLDYSYAPVFNISSPGASGSTISSKKDANLAGDINPSVSGATDTLSSTQAAGEASIGGMSIWTIALLGALGLGGLYLISRRK